tara:strand:+ start:273 stop:1118 length:846 start_codon:yes stop_codon:yes gene_type:complete
VESDLLGRKNLLYTKSNSKCMDNFPKRIFIYNDSASLSEAIVNSLERKLRERLLENSPKPLGLATGRTMEPIYKALVRRLMTWSKVERDKLLDTWCSFNLDEYIGISANDSKSFRSYMIKNLASPLGLNLEKLKIPLSQTDNPTEEANSYKNQLNRFGGIGLQLLGLGKNGHIGFNEPPCEKNASCRVEKLSFSTREQNAYAFHCDLNKVPSHAITLGLREILDSDEIYLIVTGKEKSSILSDLFISPVSPNLPASWLRFHKEVYIWTDKSAASEIPNLWH